MASALDSAQFAMTGAVLRLPRDQDETDAEFFRRRARVAANKIESKWSVKVASRISSWASHIERNHAESWPGKLVKYRDERWLRVQRILANSSSAFAGKLGLRAAKGRPRTRWDTAVEFARSIE